MDQNITFLKWGIVQCLLLDITASSSRFSCFGIKRSFGVKWKRTFSEILITLIFGCLKLWKTVQVLFGILSCWNGFFSKCFVGLVNWCIGNNYRLINNYCLIIGWFCTRSWPTRIISQRSRHKLLWSTSLWRGMGWRTSCWLTSSVPRGRI